MGGWTGELIDRWTGVCVGEQLRGKVNRWIEGRMHGIYE